MKLDLFIEQSFVLHIDYIDMKYGHEIEKENSYCYNYKIVKFCQSNISLYQLVVNKAFIYFLARLKWEKKCFCVNCLNKDNWLFTCTYTENTKYE